MAMRASKGPGKTALLAWLGWNFLLTRPHPNIAATSISADNLRDNLWKEMAVWRNKSKLLQEAFVWQKERIFAKDHPETWFMSARSWPKAADETQLGNTLAGLHADYILFLLDESGGMPNEITQSAEAALSSCKEGHIVQAGNTNSLEGALYTACVKQAKLWKVIVISGDPDDPKRSSRVNIEWARQQIAANGRESPFIKVMILGEWPAASLNALIGPDEVEAAMRREYKEHDYYTSARILGVDVARFGDDASVIFPRQGLQAFTPIKLRGVNGVQGAGHVARKWTDWDADACFVDDTGGFGSSWIDNLQTLGRNPIGIHFAGEPLDKRYYNKRAEMMFLAVEWIKKGGALPHIPEFLTAITQTNYSFKGDRLIVEPKEIIKAKIGFSPDDLDSFILTTAAPVLRAAPTSPWNRQPVHESNYDPLSRDHIMREMGLK